MQIDHDNALALEELTLLVNTDDRDVLADQEALVSFLDERGISGTRAGDGEELTAMRHLRQRLRHVFDLVQADRRDAITEINSLIADTGAVPRLVEHDGLPAHLHFTPSHAPLDRRLGAEIGVALAILVRDGSIDRLRLCASPDCTNVLIDLSKNRSRRYCSIQCANRQHVAAYRQRQAGADPLQGAL